MFALMVGRMEVVFQPITPNRWQVDASVVVDIDSGFGHDAWLALLEVIEHYTKAFNRSVWGQAAVYSNGNRLHATIDHWS